ncbi:hypothetical protein AB0J68_16435 [Micromonospora sp. NPDC049580]|uniref:hypothetical protein n=1 Tax=unclassified Micromonospora TaxID=2617518 RepID=UPI0033AA86F0
MPFTHKGDRPQSVHPRGRVSTVWRSARHVLVVRRGLVHGRALRGRHRAGVAAMLNNLTGGVFMLEYELQ